MFGNGLLNVVKMRRMVLVLALTGASLAVQAMPVTSIRRHRRCIISWRAIMWT